MALATGTEPIMVFIRITTYGTWYSKSSVPECSPEFSTGRNGQHHFVVMILLDLSNPDRIGIRSDDFTSVLSLVTM